MAAELLWLICAGAVLFSAEAQDPYDDLQDNFKVGVNLALEQLSSHSTVQHHFRFLRSLEKSDMKSGFGVTYLFHHFYLKPTKCAKGTTESNPQRCPFRNDRPLMDCAVCYKMTNGQIETEPRPYIHCIQKPRLTEEMKTARVDHWRGMTYHTGSGTLMARTSPR